MPWLHETDRGGISDVAFRNIVETLPAAVYVTDSTGSMIYYNEAAAALWGHRPELGDVRWEDLWKLYTANGEPLSYDQCPMAIALRDQHIIEGAELIAERLDGSRVPFVLFPRLLHDRSGEVSGAVNMLVDLTDHKQTGDYAEQLASIVESSDDAIISKDLNGVITSWNRSAERVFGFTAEEAIGRPITILIPEDHLDEEPGILERIRRGETVDRYETVRQRKDGRLLPISLSVSPVKSAYGKIIGASKIARDITERRRAEAQQQLLLKEMDHRVKNLFTLASSVVTLSARTATTPTELASEVRQRLDALARAHALTLPRGSATADRRDQPANLHALIRAIVAPYNDRSGENPMRVAIIGPDVPLANSSVTSLALLLNEFTTNAAKYGALAISTGQISIECSEANNQFILTWTEHGGPPIEHGDRPEGFGSLLERATIESQFDGAIAREWRADGLTIRLSIARSRMVA